MLQFFSLIFASKLFKSRFLLPFISNIFIVKRFFSNMLIHWPLTHDWANHMIFCSFMILLLTGWQLLTQRTCFEMSFCLDHSVKVVMSLKLSGLKLCGSYLLQKGESSARNWLLSENNFLPIHRNDVLLFFIRTNFYVFVWLRQGAQDLSATFCVKNASLA